MLPLGQPAGAAGRKVWTVRVKDPSDKLLSLEGVTKSYATGEGPVQVLAGVDLTLAAGESLALTGESGSGKSTLLHLAAGLDAADAGRIVVAGHDISQAGDAERARLRRGTVGLVFQQFNLIPSLDVAANLAFQSRLAGRHDPQWQAELAETLGLAACLHRYPEQLSAASSSGWPSAGRLPPAPASCWPTSPPATSTRPRAMPSWRFSCAS